MIGLGLMRGNAFSDQYAGDLSREKFPRGFGQRISEPFLYTHPASDCFMACEVFHTGQSLRGDILAENSPPFLRERLPS
jgi:hypothetical protein